MLIQMNTDCASEHFQWSEIVCRDGRNSLEWNAKSQRHLAMVEDLRVACDFAFKVSSWYRTLEWNAKEGGENGSLHTKGCATDVLFGSTVLMNDSILFMMKTVWKYLNVKNGTIGAMLVYSWGIHFDSYDDPTHQAALRKGEFYYRKVGG